MSHKDNVSKQSKTQPKEGEKKNKIKHFDFVKLSQSAFCPFQKTHARLNFTLFFFFL